MKKLFLLFNKLYRKKVLFSIILLSIALIFGIYGNYKIYGDFFKSITTTLSYFGLNSPDKVNWEVLVSFILIVIVIFLGTIVLVLRNKMDVFLMKNSLKDKNIVLFGFGEINKNFLENFKDSNREENIIVVDKEDKNFDEFWEKGYVFLKKEINEELLNLFDFENTIDIIVALGNDRINIDTALKLLDKLKDIKTETKLIVHIDDSDIGEIFFEKMEEIKQIENKNVLVNIKVFSLKTEIVDDLFDKYVFKLVPYEYARLNGDKNELKIAILGNSDLNLEIIKRIFINFVFPNNLKIKLFLIDENEKEFLEKVKYETNFSNQKYPHIILQSKKLTYDLLKDKRFWLQDDLIDVIIAFDDEDKNLKIAIDLFEKVFVHQEKKNLKYPNLFFAMFDELSFSDYIDKNKNHFKNFFTFGNLKEILSVENLLDDEKFEIAMKIHSSWDKEKDIKKAWYSTSLSNRLSSIAQYEHIPLKLLSLGFGISKDDENDEVEKYENIIQKIKRENIGFEEFLQSGDYFALCNTEHRRWMAYHFINNWEYDDFEGKDKQEKEYKKSLKLHHCLTDFKNFKYDSVKKTFSYDFNAYEYIPEYLKGKYKVVKVSKENESE